MSVAAVFVHYHAARWLAGAVASFRRDHAGAEIVVVDNGSRPEERHVLRGLPASYVDAGANRGYAGGVNLGVSQTKADYVFLLNPDVEVLPGCVGALLDVLEAGAAVAGPRLSWDRAQRLLLPPTETRTRRGELLRTLAPWRASLARAARRSWRRHARAHWLAEAPLTSWALSGAFLALRRDAWARVGPFDEGFKLYFEETDWLERARRQGLRGCLVPAARAVHFYNQSAAREPAAGAWFAESARRFERRYYGAWFLAARDRIGARLPAVAPLPAPRHERPPEVDVGPGPAWVEVSPSPLGFPAAAERLSRPERGRWTLPAEVWDHLAPGTYGGRIVDDAGEETHAFSFTRPDARRG